MTSIDLPICYWVDFRVHLSVKYTSKYPSPLCALILQSMRKIRTRIEINRGFKKNEVLENGEKELKDKNHGEPPLRVKNNDRPRWWMSLVGQTSGVLIVQHFVHWRLFISSLNKTVWGPYLGERRYRWLAEFSKRTAELKVWWCV